MDKVASAIASCLVLALMVSVSSGNAAVEFEAEYLHVEHSPILIDGNDDFTSENGVAHGSGTELDPYILENLRINASSANGIEIRNTTAHFIVRNCVIHDGEWQYHGVRLVKVENGTLSSNTCSDSCYGVYLVSSDSNRLTNNSCSNNTVGICLSYSNDNTLSNNTCSNNTQGISLVESNCNRIVNSTCNLNYYYGIYLTALSSGNILANNTCLSNGDAGISCSASSCSMYLTNNTCSGNDYGMWFYYSDGNTLVNNTCSDNAYGVHLIFSDSNAITNNTFNSNYLRGVSLRSGSENVIWRNTFNCNNGAGKVYDPNHVQAYDDGTDNQWNSSDGYGNFWSDWTTPDLVPPFGVVDLPYEIEGIADAKDYYPLKLLVNSPPTASFTISPLAGSVGTIFSVDASSSTDSEDITNMLEVRWDWEDDGTWDTSWDVEKTASHQYAVPGEYTVRLAVADSGLLTDQSTAQVMVKDDENPTTSVQLFGTLGGDGWYVSEVEIILDADDEWSDIDVTQFRIDEGAWQSYSAPFDISDDGLHILEWFSEDDAGNIEDVQSTQIKIDNGTVFDTGTVNISLACSDSCSGVDCVEYRPDDGQYETCESETYIQLSQIGNGTHELSVRVSDHAGNEIVQELTFRVEVAESPQDSGEVEVGVRAGDWIRLDYRISNAPYGISLPSWIMVEFLSVEGTNATVRMTMHMTDGSEEEATAPVDVVSGGEVLGLSGFVIPVDTCPGDMVCVSGYEDVWITGETTRKYAGASRIVVYASVYGFGFEGDYYWDKQTGVLLEVDGISSGISVVALAVETNMWNPESSDILSNPTALFALAMAICAVVAVVAFIVRRRRKAPPKDESPQS
jgi:parallel beta-helix repeat protein